MLLRSFPPTTEIVPSVLPAGSAILAAPPKSGKTFMALEIALAVAAGGRALGSIEIQRGDVLFLALENNSRSLQRRMALVAPGIELRPGAFTYATMAPNAPRMPQAETDLRQWADTASEPRLIVIDTLAVFRENRHRRDPYAVDYEDIRPLTILAHERDIAIMLLHHTRKLEAADPLATVSGSYGLTGAANTVWVLRRERGEHDAALFVTGHDVEEQELALRRAGVVFTLMGGAAEYRLSKTRRVLRDLVAELGKGTPKDIHERAAVSRPDEGLTLTNVKTTLWRMAEAGELASAEGVYSIPSELMPPSGGAVTAVTAVTEVPAQARLGSSDGYSGYTSYSTLDSADCQASASCPSCGGPATLTPGLNNLNCPACGIRCPVCAGAMIGAICPECDGAGLP